ncbi:MAG TPA: fatty acid--CoA ligase family protein, partial [Vicinamibacterales bacterium]|nr:fatty acid--CoA ligase family protein [Vicinamibacterales bacterium]
GSADSTAAFAGQSVLVAIHNATAAAATLFALNGVARRIVVCTPDLGDDARREVARRAHVDMVVDVPLRSDARHRDHHAHCPTEWVLLTSGTSGAPKLVVHTFATLTAAFASSAPPVPNMVWGTFYDVRRYGGLQILLRAWLSGAPIVIREPDESTGDYLRRAGASGVTHMSGTPSHWRRALMSPDARSIAPRYVRLSGEVADQAILSALQARYPDARVAHAFASTEAGLGFEINDGLEGFPASLLTSSGPRGDEPGADVAVAVVDGSLRLRSMRTALRYLDDDTPIADAEGWVDTGDMIERRGERCHFLGRRSGLINVGGLKVYPEEVEAAINRHPAVRASLVRSTHSSITGSLVAADVVLQPHVEGEAACRREIVDLCRRALPPHKIPAMIRFVSALDVAATGKVARRA